MSSHLFHSIEFSDLDGWADDNHLSAFECFRRSARIIGNVHPERCITGIDPGILKQIGALALESQLKNNNEARTFFETHFVPCAIAKSEHPGLLTAYFEPELKASRTPSSEYQFPVYRRPDDLVDLDDQNRPTGISKDCLFGRRAGSQILPYFDRDAINRGALAGQGLEIFWLKDLIECYHMHVQGSARLRLENGEVVRISYAAKNGYPYTNIGKVLVDLGEMRRQDVTMQTISQWLYQNPDRQLEILAHNRSYIFYVENNKISGEMGPIGAAGISLTPGRSLAIDHQLYPYGLPFWVRTQHQFTGMDRSLARLLIAQDTGSAITGSQRGDYFIGSGEEAGNIAGQVKHAAELIAFLPAYEQVQDVPQTQ